MAFEAHHLNMKKVGRVLERFRVGEALPAHQAQKAAAYIWAARKKVGAGHEHSSQQAKEIACTSRRVHSKGQEQILYSDGFYESLRESAWDVLKNTPGKGGASRLMCVGCI